MPHVVCPGEAALVPQFLLKMSRAEFHGKPVIKLSKEGWAVPAIPYLARLSFDLCAGLFETADSWVCNQLPDQNQFKETLQIKFLFALCFVSFALYDLTFPSLSVGPTAQVLGGGHFSFFLSLPNCFFLGHPYIRWTVDSLIDLKKGVYSQEKNL